MNDIEAIDAYNNELLDKYLDGESNWIACEDFIHEELNVCGIDKLIDIASNKFNISKEDIRDMLRDMI